MTAIVMDWRLDLIKAHRGLFNPRSGAPGAAQGYPDCGDGWRDILERTFARLEAALAAGGTFRSLQIKEKYGTLRLYWSGGMSDEVEAKVKEAIDLAEARSACTCEQCGEEGCLYRAGGVLMTRCTAHAKGQLVEVKPCLQNLHLVQRIVQGGARVISCCRYDRASDAFIDVSPHSLGIEEELHGEVSLPGVRRGRDVCLRRPPRLSELRLARRAARDRH